MIRKDAVIFAKMTYNSDGNLVQRAFGETAAEGTDDKLKERSSSTSGRVIEEIKEESNSQVSSVSDRQPKGADYSKFKLNTQ